MSELLLEFLDRNSLELISLPLAPPKVDASTAKERGGDFDTPELSSEDRNAMFNSPTPPSPRQPFPLISPPPPPVVFVPAVDYGPLPEEPSGYFLNFEASL